MRYDTDFCRGGCRPLYRDPPGAAFGVVSLLREDKREAAPPTTLRRRFLYDEP